MVAKTGTLGGPFPALLAAETVTLYLVNCARPDMENLADAGPLTVAELVWGIWGLEASGSEDSDQCTV